MSNFTILRTFVLAIVCALSTSALAFAGTPKTVNVVAGDLTDALEALAKQCGVDVIYPSSQLNGLKTEGVSGLLETKAAFEKLILGTALVVREEGGSVLIMMPTKSNTAEAGSVALRVAQAENQKSETSALAPDDAEDKSAKLEEIVVTAQKRKENLDDVPISISVLNGATLDGAKFSSVADALSSVPGVAVMEGFQSGGNAIAVRGVASGGTIFFGSSSTAYYLDAVPFGMVTSAFAPDSNPYDLDRVEVLRGPQGTLYGASALNGVVRVLTKSPDLDAFGLKARSTLFHTEHGEPSYRGDVAVNVPIVDDKLAVRVVAGYEDRGGWVDKINIGEKDVNSGSLVNLRAKIKAQPTDNLSIELSAWHTRDEYEGFGSAGRGWTTPATRDESLLVEYDVFGATVSYDLPTFTISSTTGYMNFENLSSSDFGWLYPIQLRTLITSEVLSEELLLNSNGQGPWRWTAGMMYRASEDRGAQTYDGSAPDRGDGYIRSESAAIFGELTRELGSLELTAGLRYFEDNITVDQPQQAFQSENKVDNISPRLVLAWHANDDATVYASYARGFRSGGPDLFGINTAGLPSLTPDTLSNYEVGAKGNFLDGLFAYDIAVYYMDWQDIQLSRTLTLPNGNVVTGRLNGDSASGFGTDIGLTLRPTTGLALGLTFSWNDLELDSDVLTVLGGQDVVFQAAGERIPFSPKYTAGMSADYSFPLGGPDLTGVLSASANYISKQFHKTNLFDQILSQTSDNTIIGRASFTIESPRNWQLTLFANNINNEKGVVAPDLFNYVPVRARPRTLGVQVGYTF